MASILVVDDDPLVCAAMRSWLEARGFVVFQADGAIAGLEILEHAIVDVMVVDIFMPGMYGFESIRTFHQRAPGVPLIAISGLMFRDHLTPAPDFLRMATNLGATLCLRKPFKPSELLEAIESCLGRGSSPLMTGTVGA